MSPDERDGGPPGVEPPPAPGPDPGPDPDRGPRTFPPPGPGADLVRPAAPPTFPPTGPPSDRVLPDLETVERWARDVGACGGTAPEDARYDVETITVDGMHHVVRSTSRSPGGGAGIPPDAARPPNAAECAAVRSVVRALLDLAGHQSGPSRIGVAFTDGRPRVVAWDVTPRPGGGPPPGDAADRTCCPRFPPTGNAPGSVRERPPGL